MSVPFDDVVVVTGAGRGLGHENVLPFRCLGAAVLVNDPGVEITRPGHEGWVADAVVAEIAHFGRQAAPSYQSVVSRRDAEAIVQGLELK